MVVTKNLADDAGALAVTTVKGQPHLGHGEKDPAVYGLEAVPDVRQCPADDHAHGVIEVRPAHFIFDVYGKLVFPVAARRYERTSSGRRRALRWIFLVW